MNCELQWSPCREDRFLLLLGNELRFYNADAALQSRPGEALRPPELFAVPFCDEHLPLRTVAWQPTSDYGNSELLAIGLSTGKVLLRSTMGEDSQGLHNRLLTSSRQQLPSTAAGISTASRSSIAAINNSTLNSLSISVQQQQQQLHIQQQQQQQQQSLQQQQQQQQQSQHAAIAGNFRSPLFLRWNPRRRGLLAWGIDRSGGGGGGGGKLSRTETVLLVWDVHSQGSAQSVNSPKTALEATGNESVVSFDWVSEKNFVCGTASKHLRIYDLDQCSANQPIGAYDQESGRVSEIYGVCQDPFQSWRLATYADKYVALWDSRRFDRPTCRFEESRLVRGINWCPSRPGWLAVSLANSSYLTLHDLSHQDSQGHRSPDYLDDLAIATDRKIRCHFEQSAQPHLAAFDWHPKRQLAAFASENGKLKVGPIRERVSACLSGAAGLAYWDGESALRLHSAPSPPPSLDPMGALMWRRAIVGYDIQGPPTAAETVEDEELLQAFNFINELCLTSTASGGGGAGVEQLRSAGALAIARSIARGSTTAAEAASTAADPAGLPQPLAVWRRQPNRQRLLQLCQWQPHLLPDAQSSEAPHQQQQQHLPTRSRRMFERVACLRLVAGRSMPEALEWLQRGERQSNNQQSAVGLSLVSVALLGALSNSLAADSASVDELSAAGSALPDLSDQLEEHPYLRVMFQFISGGPSEANMRLIVGWDAPENKPQMDLKDRIGFAAMYFSNRFLMEFLTWLNARLTRQGLLEALLLTGVNFNDDSMALLQSYLDRSNDIQSAVTLCVAIGHHSGLSLSGSAQQWLTVYRELLNNWQLFEQRAHFDLMVRRLLPRQEPPPHQTSVQVQCKFCGKRINHLLTAKVGGGPGGAQQRFRPFSSGQASASVDLAAASGGAVAMLKSKNTPA
ncbi:hypothetical protein BOX15_Mlig022549g2 [Macrostomum lignano]|uniref:MIOS-like alpha-solenoid domain-containing protein n=1 Tax=Macrostomum lignano TaxID=282301 RepID=A0A267DLX7_9PLAT|nr:hypothetical protein BOX15_Mlig022549g2 [Macrostomum lignano]